MDFESSIVTLAVEVMNKIGANHEENKIQFICPPNGPYEQSEFARRAMGQAGGGHIIVGMFYSSEHYQLLVTNNYQN